VDYKRYEEATLQILYTSITASGQIVEERRSPYVLGRETPFLKFTRPPWVHAGEHGIPRVHSIISWSLSTDNFWLRSLRFCYTLVILQLRYWLTAAGVTYLLSIGVTVNHAFCKTVV